MRDKGEIHRLYSLKAVIKKSKKDMILKKGISNYRQI